MQPTSEPIDSLYREMVLAARKMPPEQKLLAPARLFEYARNLTMASIRNQHPQATEEEVRQLFRASMKISQRLEDRR